MSEWVKYLDLESLRRLRNEGRELLGKRIDWEEKRDGECTSLMMGENETWIISSHNQEIADDDIKNRFMATPEFPKLQDLLITEYSQYGKNYISYGELLKTVSPTRIERNKKHIHWIMFDIYDFNEKRYLNYEQLYKLAYDYHIPVVRRLTQSIPKDMYDLNISVENMLKWCKRHRREGVVLKVFNGGHECTCQDCGQRWTE